MSTQQPQSNVLIVGGGPAGLALAQILRKNKISFQIFERDEPSRHRKQGWAVMLHQCLGGLYELLPEDLGNLKEVSVNHHTDDPDSLTIFDSTTMESLASIGGAPQGSPDFGIRANREYLRKFLSQYLDVQEGKNFDHYEEDADGVTVFFKDGTTARGDVLIGAEGGNSRVRSQLLQQGPVPSQFVNIIGEAEVGPEIFEPIREKGTAGIIGVQTDFRCLVGLQYIKPDRSAAGLYWFVCYRSDDPVAENQRLSQNSQQEQFDKAMAALRETSDIFVDAIRAMGPKSVAINPIKYIEYVTPDSIPKGRVMLIGDALHTMIPFRAAGANTALLDSCDLGRAIVQSHETNKTIDWNAVADQFHVVALPRGRDAVLSSRAAGESLPNGKQNFPVGARQTKSAA